MWEGQCRKKENNFGAICAGLSISAPVCWRVQGFFFRCPTDPLSSAGASVEAAPPAAQQTVCLFTSYSPSAADSVPLTPRVQALLSLENAGREPQRIKSLHWYIFLPPWKELTWSQLYTHSLISPFGFLSGKGSFEILSLSIFFWDDLKHIYNWGLTQIRWASILPNLFWGT